MSDAPDKFSFNGFSGFDIEAYRDDVRLGEIRAFSVDGSVKLVTKDATYYYAEVLLLSDKRYVRKELLKDPFDIVCTAANEHGEKMRMTVYGFKLADEPVYDEASKGSIKEVQWWEKIEEDK